MNERDEVIEQCARVCDRAAAGYRVRSADVGEEKTQAEEFAYAQELSAREIRSLKSPQNAVPHSSTEKINAAPQEPSTPPQRTGQSASAGAAPLTMPEEAQRWAINKDRPSGVELCSLNSCGAVYVWHADYSALRAYALSLKRPETEGLVERLSKLDAHAPNCAVFEDSFFDCDCDGPKILREAAALLSVRGEEVK